MRGVPQRDGGEWLPSSEASIEGLTLVDEIPLATRCLELMREDPLARANDSS